MIKTEIFVCFKSK